jgi:membrane-associated phospholipid phosphatase
VATGTTDSVAVVNAAAGADRGPGQAISRFPPTLLPEQKGAEGHRGVSVELVVGTVLVLLVALGGVYFANRPDSGAVDGWVLDVVPGAKVSWFTEVTALRYPWFIVLGAVVLFGLAFRRDRARAVACLIGPPAALFLCELVAKPLTGRTLGGSLSYPSGSTVGAAALATAAVLATPARWRTVVIVVAASYAVWMTAAVITLRWHFPTDALAGLAFGAGVVLVVDGLVHLVDARSGIFSQGDLTAPRADDDAVRPPIA